MMNMRRDPCNFLFMKESIHLGLIFGNLLFDLGSLIWGKLITLSIETTDLSLNVSIELIYLRSSLLLLLESELLSCIFLFFRVTESSSGFRS
jgi:hypothetical protein